MRECFAEILCAQAGTGAAVAAWCDDERVVDLWGGYADWGRRRPWEARSLVQPYSVSKPFAAVCALRLVEAGRLDLDAPVQRYWPEFRARATVRHVLSHQAGVVMLDRQVPTEAFYDWDYLCGLLAAQEPSWEPGTAHGESPLFYGHLAGELVRRVDGRGMGRFLRDQRARRADGPQYFGDGPGGFSHSLTGQIGGQLAVGFTLTHLAEAPHHGDATARYLPGHFATRAVKPAPGRVVSPGPASRPSSPGG